MKAIEQYISPLVQSHFPDFYKEQGPLFILFVEEYYKWLENNLEDYANYTGALLTGNPLYHSRNLLNYRDIDKTVDDFFVYFKEKYLKGVEVETNISKRRLIKASQDLFSSKGSTRSLDLFFKLIYGTKIEIYSPGEDILKPSDGTWVVPVYLELSRTSRTLQFPGKQITGSISSATAFVEYIITRNINGKLIDIAFLSDVKGNFQVGEIVLDQPNVVDAPKIVGSLSGINITAGGELFTVGEIVNIISSRGVEGQALITEIESVTGLVRFRIIDGGWGYSNTAESVVSEKVILVSNVYNTNTSITSFNTNETVSQNLYNFQLTEVVGTFNAGSKFNNGNTSTPSVSVVVSATQNAATANTANLVLNQISGNVFTNSIIYDVNKEIIATDTLTLFSIGDVIVQRNTGTGSNNTTGVISSIANVTIIDANTSTISANGLHVGVYLEQATSNASGIISVIPRENYFTFTNVNTISVKNVTGTFNNSSVITVYSDSDKTVNYGSFTPLTSRAGYEYLLIDSNLNDSTRWSYGNTAIKVGSPSVNAVIYVSSDIGGLISACNDVSATANLFASNTTHVGLISVNNTFYATSNSQIRGIESNTVANTIFLYTGINASFDVGVISDTETVRVSPDFLSSNNDAPGSNSVKFMQMLITGANSKFGNLSSVYIFNGGTGYNNTDIVTFSGGNTGAGSFTAGNASIITNSTGVITAVGLSSNTGNNITSTPNVSITTSTGTGANLVPISSLGFVKLPSGDITFRILDLLRFNTLTIGTISTLSAINPGENYNISPFVKVYEPEVAAYGKKDIVIELSNTAGPSFVTGEYVEETINTPAISIISNTFSGNASLSFEVQEVVFSTDGISNTATGIVYSTTRDLVTNVHTTILVSNTGTWQNTINVSVLTVSSNTNFEPGNFINQSTSANGILVTSNTTTLVVKNVQGSFTNGTVTSNSSPTPGSTTVSGVANTSIYKLKGLTSNGESRITNTAAYTASATARAVLKLNSNNQFLTLKRTSLFTEFVVGGTATGKTSGATGTVLSVSEDPLSLPVGENAIISANVIASEGTISNVTVISSGLGYEDNEGVTLLSLDGLRAASGQANVSNQGIGAGYYSSTRGFLDDNKYIHDGNYYQNFSYEVQTSIPLEKYFDTLKQVLHVAGKKIFGRVLTQPELNLQVAGNTTITIT